MAVPAADSCKCPQPRRLPRYIKLWPRLGRIRQCKNYTIRHGQGLLSSELPLEDQISRARVLVVDDSPTVLSLLRAALEAQQLRRGHGGRWRRSPEYDRAVRPRPHRDRQHHAGAGGIRSARTAEGERSDTGYSRDPADVRSRRCPTPGDAQPDAIITKSAQMEPLLAADPRAASAVEQCLVVTRARPGYGVVKLYISAS